jgi:hypothetical protein
MCVLIGFCKIYKATADDDDDDDDDDDVMELCQNIKILVSIICFGFCCLLLLRAPFRSRSCYFISPARLDWPLAGAGLAGRKHAHPRSEFPPR